MRISVFVAHAPPPRAVLDRRDGAPESIARSGFVGGRDDCLAQPSEARPPPAPIRTAMQQHHSGTIKLDREQRKRERAAAKLERKRTRHDVSNDGSNPKPRPNPTAPAR